MGNDSIHSCWQVSNGLKVIAVEDEMPGKDDAHELRCTTLGVV